MTADITGMAMRIRSRDRAAIARAVSLIERGEAEGLGLLEALANEASRAHRIGVTGPPGAGKSTLTMQLVRRLRGTGGSVAVIAVDPSSPFSHGALLGDRVRMNDVAADEDVFIRSMATRGALGGLSAAVGDAAEVFDAAGFDYLIVESVGVGQNELDIIEATDTVLVVLTPESGDDVQMTKAGLLEIADVYVINKDDRPGGHAIHAALTEMLHVRQGSRPSDAWSAPIVRTVAQQGDGADRLVEAILAHRESQRSSGALEARRRARNRARVMHLTRSLIEREFWSADRFGELDAALAAGGAPRASAHSIARKLVDGYLKRNRDRPT